MRLQIHDTSHRNFRKHNLMAYQTVCFAESGVFTRSRDIFDPG